VLSISLNLAFIVVWLIQAFPGWMSPPAGVDGPSDRTAVPSSLHKELGVSAEQWEKIEPVLRKFRQTAKIQQQEIMTLRSQLLELLAATPADKKAIRAKQEEILAGQRRMQNLVVDHLLKEKEILSPSQAVKLIQTLCDQCRHAEGMGSGHGLGPVLGE